MEMYRCPCNKSMGVGVIKISMEGRKSMNDYSFRIGNLAAHLSTQILGQGTC